SPNALSDHFPVRFSLAAALSRPARRTVQNFHRADYLSMAVLLEQMDWHAFLGAQNGLQVCYDGFEALLHHLISDYVPSRRVQGSACEWSPSTMRALNRRTHLGSKLRAALLACAASSRIAALRVQLRLASELVRNLCRNDVRRYEESVCNSGSVRRFWA